MKNTIKLKNIVRAKTIYRMAGFAALVAVFGFSFAACDDLFGKTPTIYEPAVYHCSNSDGTDYILTITRTDKAAVQFTPAGGDSYTLIISMAGETNKSTGTVKSFSDNKFTLAPSSNASATLEVTVIGIVITGITSSTQTIPVDGGGTVPAPGALTPANVFLAVTGITGVPASGTVGTLTLTGTVEPANATNRTIVWSLQNAGTTGATVSGNTLTTTAAGTATVRATITNGTAAGTDYTKDFPISISVGSPGNDLGNGLYLLENADYRDFAIEARLDATQWANVTNRSNCGDVLKEISKKVYAKFKDDFDFIFFVLNYEEAEENDPVLSALGFMGRNYGVSNSVNGLGRGKYDWTSSYGSAGKLKSLMYFPIHDAIEAGPTLHELAHNWGAYICPTFIPGEDGDESYSGHWGVSNAGGQLGGFKYVREVSPPDSNGAIEYQGSIYDTTKDGAYTRGFGINANGGNGIPYSDIELYLMGMIGADQLPKDFSLDIYTGLSFDSKFNVDPITNKTSFKGYFKATGKTSYTIDDLINLNGARVPDAKTSQKDFKVLTVILSNSGDTAASTRYAKVVKDLKWFAGLIPYDGYYIVNNFKQATRNLGSLEVGGITNSLIQQ